MKIYLHIGAGKCGSSSIQHYFSKNPILNERTKYGCIEADGKIITGDLITKKSEKNVFDYYSSVSIKNLKDKNQTLEHLRKLSKSTDKLILSNEGWLNELSEIEAIKDIFIDFDVEVIFIIRSPLEWLNSAWWQWGAWTNLDHHTWLKLNIENILWHDKYKEIHKLNFVKKIHVINLTKDILNEFFEIIKEEYDSCTSSNKSSDQRILDVFLKRRTLRPSPHECHVEFSLNRHLKSVGKPKWVINEELCEEILRKSNNSNKEIAKLSKNSLSILNDERWWKVPNLDVVEEHLSEQNNQDVLLDLLEESFLTIHKLDMKLRKINK